MASWILSAMMCAVVSGNPDCTIVHFTAGWCEPCKQIEPALQQLRQEGWTIQTVDVDRQLELVQQFRIENLPTLAILCRDQEVDRMVGAASYERIVERVERAAARNQSGPARAQLVPNQVSHDPRRIGSHSQGANEACNQTDGTTHASAVPTAAPRVIVRGQSPELRGFSLLTSNTNSREPGAFDQQAALAESKVGQTKPAQMKPAASPNGERRSTSESRTLSVEQAIARAAAATVRIRVDEANSTAYGTGTIVDVRGQDALILTCGHLFREMQPHSKLTIDLFPALHKKSICPVS
ncbi:MAG: thioredoxin family protein [Aureliella sp.]